MSRIAVILITGLYAFTLFQAYVPHVNYWMNQEYIATVLCENQDMPELKCEGKCHLKKEIEQTENDQQEGRVVSIRLMVEYFQPIAEFTFRRFVAEGEGPNFHYSERVFAAYSDPVFRPPQG